MALSLADLETISNVAMRMDANPVTLLGRVLGLSAQEQAAGVPKWGWIALAAGAAVAGGLVLRKHFSKNGGGKSDGAKRASKKKKVIRSRMFRATNNEEQNG